MKKILLILICAVLLVLPLLAVIQTASGTSINDPLGGTDIKGLIIKLAKAVASIVGGVVAIMFIVAGIIFLTSAGSPERINQAKGCLTYAIIGTVIALSAEGLANFIAGIFG